MITCQSNVRKFRISIFDNQLSILVKIWLPQKKYCRLSFLQEIIQDKKKHLLICEVKQHEVIRCGWNEFALKNIIHLISDDIKLHQYLPWEEMLEGRYPNKDYFWAIAFTLKPEWASKYFRLSQQKRD